MKLDPKTLKQERRQAGMTQKELASASGVSYSLLTKLEQGKVATPSITTVQQLAEALHCTAADLLESSNYKLADNPGIKFVYFDVGGVLVHWLPSVQAFAERIGRPYEDVLQIFYTYEGAGCRGKVTLEDLQMLILLKLNVKLTSDNREELLKPWLEDMRPILPMHKFLQTVAASYPVGLLTNVFRGYYPAFFEYGLVPELKYKTIIKSCDHGVKKPDHKLFEIAAQAARTPAGEILFIDDNRTNIKAAREFGFKAEWFDEYQPQQSVQRIVKNHFTKA